jgi:predicted transcriptional regulator
MPTTLTPIKVSAETDQLIGHAAHFLYTSKKDIVDRAIRDYIEAHRAELNEGVRSVLAELGDNATSAVCAMTGLSTERLAELGGVPDD